MRELWIGTNSICSEGGDLTCEYFILVGETGGNFPCESYGVKIVLSERGECAEIWDISLNAEKILELGKLLCRNVVTPCALMDVIQDWL